VVCRLAEVWIWGWQLLVPEALALSFKNYWLFEDPGPPLVVVMVEGCGFRV
jgi:hypothetical protein